MITLYVSLSAFLFSIGTLIVLTKKNIIVILMGIELILNAANLNLVVFGQFDAEHLRGHTFALFITIVATAEVAVALAIVWLVYKYFKTANIDELKTFSE
ncbi:MAG: NADH-quinone oxidoreductase subunit NuoK [Bacteroidetes bacterium]|nr:MAG: NADH-quinone oxidoreductase subunit NuoK [Bacteroidota bacterium]TAG86955.1 MAG: NADH-quinone oxidoreductase subunit NuoK [Bacteroidota bacterium]